MLVVITNIFIAIILEAYEGANKEAGGHFLHPEMKKKAAKAARAKADFVRAQSQSGPAEDTNTRSRAPSRFARAISGAGRNSGSQTAGEQPAAQTAIKRWNAVANVSC